jgi:hypothetical protein
MPHFVFCAGPREETAEDCNAGGSSVSRGHIFPAAVNAGPFGPGAAGHVMGEGTETND